MGILLSGQYKLDGAAAVAGEFYKPAEVFDPQATVASATYTWPVAATGTVTNVLFKMTYSPDEYTLPSMTLAINGSAAGYQAAVDDASGATYRWFEFAADSGSSGTLCSATDVLTITVGSGTYLGGTGEYNSLIELQANSGAAVNSNVVWYTISGTVNALKFTKIAALTEAQVKASYSGAYIVSDFGYTSTNYLNAYLLTAPQRSFEYVYPLPTAKASMVGFTSQLATELFQAPESLTKFTTSEIPVAANKVGGGFSGF